MLASVVLSVTKSKLITSCSGSSTPDDGLQALDLKGERSQFLSHQCLRVKTNIFSTVRVFEKNFIGSGLYFDTTWCIPMT